MDLLLLLLLLTDAAPSRDLRRPRPGSAPGGAANDDVEPEAGEPDA